MTTPCLLLAAGGVLVASGAVAAFRRPAQTKPFDESKLKLAKPGPPPPKITTLDRPFTLVYRLMVTDLRTKSMREAIIATRMADLAKEVDADRKTQAQADEEIARMRVPRRPSAETITLAYDGKALFYENDPGGDKPRSNINLFDGKHSTFFQMKVPGGKYGAQGGQETGTVQYHTWNMPYVGPSLPFFPVTRGRDVLILAAFDDKLVYRPFGRVAPGPKGTAGKILIGRFDPQDAVVLSKWTPMHGTVVAGSVVLTKQAYSTDYAQTDMGKPEWRYEYTLVSSRPSADPVLFRTETYVNDGMTFLLDGGKRHFDFDSTKGTLEDQIAAHGRVGP